MKTLKDFKLILLSLILAVFLPFIQVHAQGTTHTSEDMVSPAACHPETLQEGILREGKQCTPMMEGGFRLFLTSNEGEIDKTIGVLSDFSKVGQQAGNTFVGTSAFFSLDAAAALGLNLVSHSEAPGKIENIIILDSSGVVESFWKWVAQNIVEVEDFAVFSKRLIKYLNDEAVFLFQIESRMHKFRSIFPEISIAAAGSFECNARLAQLVEIINSSRSWLSKQRSYNFIRDIFRAGRFAFKRVNFYHPLELEGVARFMQRRGLKINTIYLSNIREYAESDEAMGSFRLSVDHLRSVMDESTMLIDTQPREGGLSEVKPLVQRRRRKITEAKIESVIPDTTSRR